MSKRGSRSGSPTTAPQWLGSRERAACPRLLQVHPVPSGPEEILSVAQHLLRYFARASGKVVPILSQDAAAFLTTRVWAADDLARRLSRAVASNRGSLITAADLFR